MSSGSADSLQGTESKQIHGWGSRASPDTSFLHRAEQCDRDPFFAFVAVGFSIITASVLARALGICETVSFTHRGWFQRFHDNCTSFYWIKCVNTITGLKSMKTRMTLNFQSRDLENHWQPDTLLHMLYKVTVYNMTWQISYNIANN